MQRSGCDGGEANVSGDVSGTQQRAQVIALIEEVMRDLDRLTNAEGYFLLGLIRRPNIEASEFAALHELVSRVRRAHLH
jgi:hypothetical protein